MNKQHLTVYIRRILTLNLECYTHDRRLNLDTMGPFMQISIYGVLQECVDEGRLEVYPKEMVIFDPQLYRRLLAEIISNTKDSRFVLFALAFPTHQLSSDSTSAKLLKQRQKYVVENIDKLQDYFEISSENSEAQTPKELAK